jgi:hypothetical protein
MPGLALWRDEHPIAAGGGERRAFRNPPTAGGAKHRLRALGEARRFGEQGGHRKEPRRHPEFRGECMNPRFAELQLDRHDCGDCSSREARLGERRARQLHNLLGGAAALAADAERQDGRVENQGVGIRIDLTVGHDDTFLAALRPADRASSQPLGTRYVFDQ